MQNVVLDDLAVERIIRRVLSDGIIVPKDASDDVVLEKRLRQAMTRERQSCPVPTDVVVPFPKGTRPTGGPFY